MKKHKPYFDEDQRKQTKLQWLQDQSEINGDNLNNIKCEASRHLGIKEGISKRQN
jgi:hypothetical protein